MTVAESRATCCHRGVDPCLVHGDDIGVTLDDHSLAFRCNGLTGPVESEEDVGLVIDDRLGRIHVLGIRIVGGIPINVGNKTAAKPDGVAPDVVDGKHQSSPKHVVQTLSSTTGQSPVQHRPIIHAGSLQSLGESVPVDPGETHLPLIYQIDVIAAASQVGPSRASLCGLLQPSVIDVHRLPNGFDRCLPPPPLPGSIRVLDQGDAGLAGKDLQGIGEVNTLCLLNKGKDIPSLAAAKTVIKTAHSVDRHRGGLLFVKRANGHDRPAGLFHLGHLGDQLNEVGRLPDPIDVSSVCHRHRS